MNKVFGFGLTRVLFTALALFVAVGIAHAGAPLTFVANDDELNIALESAAQGTIGNVAVAQSFYQGSAKRTKDRIRGLIARTFELGDRAVYIFGPSLDAELASQLLDEEVRCTGGYAIGKIPGWGAVCFGSVGAISEETMRHNLSSDNERKRSR